MALSNRIPQENETGYDSDNSCHKLIREALVLYNAELLRQGIDQRPLSLAMKNVWRELSIACGQFNLSCQQQQDAISFAIKAQRKKSGHLDRILVQEIVHLFPHKQDRVTQKKITTEYIEGMIPRGVIQGYISGIKDMFGFEFIDGLQERLDEIIYRYEDGKTNVIHWEGVYDDPMTEGMRKEIFTRISSKFDAELSLIPTFADRITKSEKYQNMMERELEPKEFEAILKCMFLSISQEKTTAYIAAFRKMFADRKSKG